MSEIQQSTENEEINSLPTSNDETGPKNERKPEDEKLLQEQFLKLDELQMKNNEMLLKIQYLEHDLQLRIEERENCKNKICNLESEIKELKKQQPNTLNAAQQKEVDKIKKVSEEMLTKAKGVIFEKTKLCQNQELQIEAFNQQVTSLKEVLAITKDLLEIRNMEVKHLEEKMECMELKINAEKQRHDLMHQKLDTMVQMNTDLKGEYEIQLRLFNELRTHYAEREQLQNNNSQQQN